jgi:hypothetical protein
VSYRRAKPILIVDRIEALGPSLRDLRRSQHVGIYDVADAMDSSHGTQVTSWETGRVKPGSAKVVELLTVYDYVMVFMNKTDAANLVAERSRVRADDGT